MTDSLSEDAWVVPQQLGVAVFVNTDGELSIMQRNDGQSVHPEDLIVIVGRANAERVAAKILELSRELKS